MSNALIDVDAILLENEQWVKLEEEWGMPIDLETEEDEFSAKSSTKYTLDLKKTTFNSSFLFTEVRRKLRRHLSRKSASFALEYEDFLNDLRLDETRESSKDYYFINGEVVSAVSVDDMCCKIDDIFKSIDKLNSASNTVRKKGKYLPNTIDCSISIDGLSFDDTIPTCNEGDTCDIEQSIEEVLDKLNSTLINIDGVDETTIDSVTTLVRKYSNVSNNPFNCSPRKERPCCVKFKELTKFWSNHTP